MKKYCLFMIILVCLLSSFCICAAEQDVWDDATAAKMRQVDELMSEIRSLPGAIDEDICSKNWSSYKEHMTLLAQKIIDVNTLLDGVKLVYPIDLWSVYNTISASPDCGVGKKALSIFGVADVSVYSNEERMGINENDDLCFCWNIITGREELTGFYKDGACRCTYGINNHNPDIGIVKDTD